MSAATSPSRPTIKLPFDEILDSSLDSANPWSAFKSGNYSYQHDYMDLSKLTADCTNITMRYDTYLAAAASHYATSISFIHTHSHQVDVSVVWLTCARAHSCLSPLHSPLTLACPRPRSTS